MAQLKQSDGKAADGKEKSAPQQPTPEQNSQNAAPDAAKAPEVADGDQSDSKTEQGDQQLPTPPAPPPPPPKEPIAPEGVDLPPPVPKEALPPKHKRPSLEEYVAAGYPAEWYELRMRNWEAEVARDYADLRSRNPLEPGPTEAKGNRPPRNVKEDVVRVRAKVTVLHGGMPIRAGSEFWVPRERAEVLKNRGEIEIL